MAYWQQAAAAAAALAAAAAVHRWTMGLIQANLSPEMCCMCTMHCVEVHSVQCVECTVQHAQRERKCSVRNVQCLGCRAQLATATWLVHNATKKASMVQR